MRLLMIVALGLGSGPAAAAEDPIDPPSATICGDGIVDATEACDDGSTGGGSTGGDGPADGDGCSATCTIEPGYACDPSGCAPICGDGLRVGAEACDDGVATTGGGTFGDGRPASGDGCSATCTIELGYTCDDTACVTTCGDAVRAGSETCDVSGLGCSATCTIEPGYTCDDTVCVTTCGDGVRAGSEACDVDSDGCDAYCTIEPGYACEDTACVRICGEGLCVGRETHETGETHDDLDELADSGGCSTTRGGPSAVVALALAGLLARRRRRAA